VARLDGGKKEEAVPVVDTVPTGMGWRLATFASERLEPQAEGLATQSEIWEAYLAWCAARKEEPIAVVCFDREFTEVAEAAGIERVQYGANVIYRDVAVKG